MDIIRSIQVKILGKFRPPPTSRTCISDPSEFPHFECLTPVLNQIICIVVTLGKRCWWPMENALLFHRPQQQEENKREKVSASHCGQNENDRIREITWSAGNLNFHPPMSFTWLQLTWSIVLFTLEGGKTPNRIVRPRDGPPWAISWCRSSTIRRSFHLEKATSVKDGQIFVFFLTWRAKPVPFFFPWTKISIWKHKHTPVHYRVFVHKIDQI